MNAKDKKVFKEMAKARCEAIQEARKKISQPLLAPDSFSTTRPCQEGTEHSSAKSSFHLWGPPQQVLGRGTYGQVYHVKNHVHFHLAAKMASEVRTTEELAKEAALLSKLCHPGIISQFGLTSTEKQVGLLLELGDLSLWKYLLEDKDLHLPTRWILVGQLADAMKYVHQHRVVHLDLKPANVILFGVRDFPTRVTAKIADFGLARQSPAVVRGDGVYSAPYRPLVPWRTFLGEWVQVLLKTHYLNTSPAFAFRTDSLGSMLICRLKYDCHCFLH